MSSQTLLPPSLQHPNVLALLQLSLIEDLAPDKTWESLAPEPTKGDITSTATLPPGTMLRGHIYAKSEGVVAGLPVAAALCQMVDPTLHLTIEMDDGSRVESGERLATLTGPGRALLAAERPALNLLGRCSGIASLTRRFVDAIAGTKATILDTRKTGPGARRLDKYAVRRGGGQNHRGGLYDMVLIKDNHIDASGSITKAVERVRTMHGNRFPIEVEVKTLNELDEAISVQVSRILLDNMQLPTLQQAVARADGRASLEASGNVSLETVRAIAETGVDFISVGALTHSADVFDVSLRIDP